MSLRPTLQRGPLALVLALQVAPVLAQSGELRGDLEGLALVLESAAGRVSRPTRGPWSQGPRGYHLPTYGAFFCLSPRALPPPRLPAQGESDGAAALAEAARRLEGSLKGVASEDARRQIEQNIKALRQAEADLRHGAGPLAGAILSPELTSSDIRRDAPSIEKELERLEREVQARLAARAPLVPDGTRVPREVERGLQEELEGQMSALHEQVEAFRIEAERARAGAEKEILERLGAPREVAAAAPSEVASALLPSPPLLPWPYRVAGEDASDRRSGDEVVHDVQASITSALETDGWRLRQLRPEEVIVVAVDFVQARGRPGLRARPGRTLLVRVVKKALDDRHAGRMGAEEFRQSAEVVEY